MISFLREFWTFLRMRKKFWLVPIFIVMAVFGGLIVLTKGIGGRTVNLHLILMVLCAYSEYPPFITTVLRR